MEGKDEGFLKYHIHRELSLVLCDDLEGWNRGVHGRLKRDGIYIYIYIYIYTHTYIYIHTHTYIPMSDS